MTSLPPGVISRKPITHRWQIPLCEFFIWTTHPDPANGIEGTGSQCRARATHRITTNRIRPDNTPYPRTSDLCRAHIAEEIDAAHRARDDARRYHHTTVPEPTITELQLTLDLRAHAHGRHRLWLTEHQHQHQPIVLELFGTSPLLPAPRRRRKPANRTRPATHQTTLLDERGHTR